MRYVPGGSPKGLPYPTSEGFLENRRGGACPSRGPARDRSPWNEGRLPALRRVPHVDAHDGGFSLCRARRLGAPLPGRAPTSTVGAAHLGRPQAFPWGPIPPVRGKCPEGTEGIGTGSDEHFVLIVAFPRTPFTGAAPEKFSKISGAQGQECLPAFPSGPTGALRGRKFAAGAVQFLHLGFRSNGSAPSLPQGRTLCARGPAALTPGPRPGSS